MADKKISQLTVLAQGDVVVADDTLPIVDTSATETKKVTAAALVGAALTAGVTSVDINSGTIDGATIGANSAAAGTFTNLTASGTVSFNGATVSNGGSVTTIDINGGTIDGATIATSDITVGSGKTLNVSGGTLTLADNQISGDKVEGGTINAITINTLTSTAVNATTVDATNVEVTNVKAKDGTAALTIADSTGVVTASANPILNAGTANGVLYLNGSKVATSGSALTFNGTLLGITGNIRGRFDASVSDTANYGFAFATATNNDRVLWGGYSNAANVGFIQATELNVAHTNLALNPNGGNVGIGTSSPGAKLNVVGGNIRLDNNQGLEWGGANNFIYGNETTDFVAIATNGNERLRIDSSGNLGLGVTPSAWPGQSANYDVFQFGTGAVYNVADGATEIAFNQYIDSAGTRRYITTNSALRYRIGTTEHQWFTAASGTAGNAITFTQAMTLSASDRGILTVGPNGSVGTLGTDYATIGVWHTSGGGYRIYRGTGSGTPLALFYADSTAAYLGTQTTIPLVFNTNDTERARITSGGELLVGTTTANSGSKVTVGASGGGVIAMQRSTGDTTSLLGELRFGNENVDGKLSSIESYQGGATDSSDLRFYTSPTGGSQTERARITSGGYFKASNTGSYVGSADPYHEFINDATGSAAMFARSTNASFTASVLSVSGSRNTTNSTYNLAIFYNGGSTGECYIRDSGNLANTNGTYGAISDEKLKQDIADAASQWNDIKSVRVRKYRFKKTPDASLQIGVVAQELEQVSPGLVEETVDRDAEGNDLGTTTKSVKYSILYMKAVKALQEAMARIEQLEAKVAALESK